MSNFDGKGYSQNPLDDLELSRHRHMYRELDRNFIAMTDEELKAVQFVALLKKAWPFIALAFSAGVANQMGLF